MRDGGWAVGQCALAAAIAWALGQVLLGHPRPFFAAVAAVVCLGLRPVQRLRRVVELAVGVTVGVFVGGVVVSVIGSGAWQIGVVVAIALLIALALDGGPLVTAQAGLQAVFVVALPRIPGQSLARWEDALIGGLVALAVAALLPADPWRLAHRARHDVLTDLATVLRQTAVAARDVDPPAAGFALTAARATQAGLTTWVEAVRAGREITQLTPLHRSRSRTTWEREALLASSVDRAVRNLRVLVRRVLFAVGGGDALPARLPGLLEDLAATLEVLDADGADAVVAPLVDYAARLDPAALGLHGLSETVVVAQLRSSVVDLLEGAGIDPDRARAVLPAV